MVEAYVFIETENPGARRICQTVRQLPGVLRADGLFGGPSVVAIIRADDLPGIEAIVASIAEIEGVLDTDSHVARPIPDE